SEERKSAPPSGHRQARLRLALLEGGWFRLRVDAVRDAARGWYEIEVLRHVADDRGADPLLLHREGADEGVVADDADGARDARRILVHQIDRLVGEELPAPVARDVQPARDI